MSDIPILLTHLRRFGAHFVPYRDNLHSVWINSDNYKCPLEIKTNTKFNAPEKKTASENKNPWPRSRINVSVVKEPFFLPREQFSRDHKFRSTTTVSKNSRKKCGKKPEIDSIKYSNALLMDRNLFCLLRRFPPKWIDNTAGRMLINRISGLVSWKRKSIRLTF